jgi:hypothetical protein
VDLPHIHGYGGASNSIIFVVIVGSPVVL